MFKCKIENVKNDILTLTQDESNYQVLSITGLNPPNAQINQSTVAGLDGTKFNSSKLQARNIVIRLKINGDVEANRINLYNYFATKEWCKFYYENENRNVYIDCYVETFECDFFTNSEIAQISLICPQPYFKDVEEIIDDISKVLAAFEFPFAYGSKGATNPSVTIDTSTDDAIAFSTIDRNQLSNIFNKSESETGLIIEINVLADINKILIRNTGTGETITLLSSFVSGDKIVIDTNKGQKSVILIRNGVTSNLFTALVKGSTFLQLLPGDNFFGYAIDDGSNDDSVNILFKHNIVYRGV